MNTTEITERLAAELNANVEEITFDAIRSNVNGAALYRVKADGLRYIIEGETGEMLVLDEGIEEDEAVEQFEK